MAIDRDAGYRFAAGQVAAVHRHLCRFPRFDNRRKYGIDPRADADGEAIEIVRPATEIRELAEPHDVFAIGGQRHIGKRVGPIVVAVRADPLAFGVEDFDHRFRAAIDATRHARQYHSLPRFADERRVIDIGAGIDRAVDRRAQLDLLRFGHVVVRLLLVDLRAVADDEQPRIADTPLVDHANVVRPEWHARRHRDLELRLRGWRGFLVHLRGRCVFFLRVFGWLRVGGRRQILPRDAGVAEQQARGIVEIGAQNYDIDRGAELCPDGEDRLNARLRRECLRLLGQGHGREAHRDREEESAHVGEVSRTARQGA